MTGMNKLDRAARIRLLRCLVDGSSVRATCRINDVAKQTVLKLLVDAGRMAAAHQDRAFRNLTCKRIQCDEIWSFIGAKEKNVPEEEKGAGRGDVWTWTAIDADTKLVPSWLVGSRDGGTAAEFIVDLASRLAHRVQITTDGHKPYLEAIEGAFGCDVDYAVLIKLYGNEGAPEGAHRYSPAECTGAKKTIVQGNPDEAYIGTSHVERQNLTMRMNMRRFTRLTNGFSKKAENHAAAVALHFWNYNFARIHQSLRITPAMAAGVSDRLLDLGDLVDLLEADEAERAAANPIKPGRKPKRVQDAGQAE